MGIFLSIYLTTIFVLLIENLLPWPGSQERRRRRAAAALNKAMPAEWPASLEWWGGYY